MGNTEDIVGIVAGILTSTSLLPQLFKMFKEKKSTDISLPMLCILLAGVALWVWYGVLKSDLPIIVTNVFSLAVNLLIIFFRWYYGRRERR